MYILDTFAWVELFKKTEKGAKVFELIKSSPCFTSSISIAEISYWCEENRIGRKAQLDYAKSLSRIIDADHQILELAGVLKAEKRKTAGSDFGLVDAIILATGRMHGLQLVTGYPHFKNENVLML